MTDRKQALRDKRCQSFVSKNVKMSVGKIAMVLGSRGYSPSEISAALIAQQTDTTKEAT